jgi:hypothetical protein
MLSFAKAPRCGSKAPFASPQTVAYRLLLDLNFSSFEKLRLIEV